MWTQENIPDQTGKTAIITGGNSGIGFETAQALYSAGANVVLACRNGDLARQSMANIISAGGKGKLNAITLDLSSLQSVKEFAQQFLQHYNELHLLVNNAGVMCPPESLTIDGYETQFGVNHLGHFALTGHLYHLLKQTPGARVVTLTSLAYLYGAIDFSNLKLEQPYDAMQTYAQSKLANLLFTIELQKKIDRKGDRIQSLAAHPGVTATNIGKFMTEEEVKSAVENFGPLMSPSQGALPSLYAATASQVEPGAFYGPDEDGGLRGYPALTPVKESLSEVDLSSNLWSYSEQATGIVYPD